MARPAIVWHRYEDHWDVEYGPKVFIRVAYDKDEPDRAVAALSKTYDNVRAQLEEPEPLP